VVGFVKSNDVKRVRVPAEEGKKGGVVDDIFFGRSVPGVPVPPYPFFQPLFDGLGVT